MRPEFWNGPTCAEVQGDWITGLLGHARADGWATIDVTTEAAEEWTTRVDAFGDATLLRCADSWYMAANIPGKRRQLLNYPSGQQYLAHLDECAADGYRGFVFS